MSLQPISPQEAVELYLQSRENELAASTLQSQEYRLNHFIRWCKETDRENLNELTGRDIQEYKNWRQADGNLNNVTLKTQIDTVRVFIRFLESINGVRENLSEKIISPTVGKENRRDEKLNSDEAKGILEYLSRYEYASNNHTLLALLWSLGCRMGTVRAFDLEDYDRDNQWLEANHRPESDTPLKNKSDGERLISLKDDLCKLLDDYIRDRRIDSIDDYDRNPLLTTENGRISKNKIRTTVYKLTCPEYPENGQNCNPSKPHECPDCVSPHAIRRGSITHYLANDAPIEVVSDRCNVSRDILDKHYDRRKETVKVEQRRKQLINL